MDGTEEAVRQAWEIEDPKARSTWIGVPKDYQGPKQPFYRQVLVVVKRPRYADHVNDGSHWCEKLKKVLLNNMAWEDIKKAS